MAVTSARSDPGGVLESLVDVVVASGWVYPLIVAIAALDAVFPLVPSEATVIAAGALAGAGELTFGVVLLAGGAGAVLGDNVAYLLGRAGQRTLIGRLLGTPAWRERIGRAETTLTRRAGTIIVVSRFVPGGRTATMLSAGLVGLRWRRFIAYDVVAGAFWAGYASVIGVVGGKAFSDEPLHALVLAFALAAALMIAIESGRRLVRAAGHG
jgi:membrane protein DedA with SNARE-associated domain